MSEHDFQREVLRRLGHMEADIKGMKAEFAGLQNQFGERCGNRGKEITMLWAKNDDIKKRVDKLEKLEEQRKGGKVVVLALLAAAGSLGGLLVKLIPSLK